MRRISSLETTTFAYVGMREKANFFCCPAHSFVRGLSLVLEGDDKDVYHEEWIDEIEGHNVF